tara:strand:+ start:4690 stop:6300 length:1611 start_codon:yes stop_codon:yes gene_type:complete
MDREQGILFLRTILSIRNNDLSIKPILGKYNIDTILMIAGSYYLYNKTQDYFKNKNIYGILQKIPFVKGYLQKKIDEAKNVIKSEFKIKNHTEITSLPEQGLTTENIKSLELNYKALRKYKYQNGMVSGTVYQSGNPEFTNLMTDTVREFMYSNPLHPDVFPDIRLMETDIINMVKKLFNGNSECCGNTTSGGTESILLACKTYRDWGKNVKGITYPQIVVGESVHGSFLKAGEYFNIEIVSVPVDKNTGKLIVKKLKNAITRNTVCIVGSAPSFAHGVTDDIEELSEIALEYNIGLHVDCCLGGFILPFIKRIGLSNSEFTFNLEGVTSISVDTHKYGNSMKGSSVILYRNKELRKHQYYVNTSWNGGIYATPTIAGSRSGVSIATTWASLLYYGLSGYTETALKIIKLKNNLLNSIMQIDGLIVIGTPATSVIAVRSDSFDIYLVGSYMTSKGWNLNILQNPKAFHICLTSLHVTNKILDSFISCLKEAVEYAKNNPDNKKSGTCAIYGMTSTVGDPNIIKEVTYGFLDTLTEI